MLIFDGEKFHLEKLSGIATGISLSKQSHPANAADNLSSSLSEAEFQGMIARPKDKNYTLINTMQNTNNSTHNHHNHHKKPVRTVSHALPVNAVSNAYHKANNTSTPSASSSVQAATSSKQETVKDDDRMSDDDESGSEEDSEGSEEDSEGDTGDFTSRLMAKIGDGSSSTNTAPLAVETVVSSNPFSLAQTPNPTPAPVAPAASSVDQTMKGNSESSSEDSESGSSEDSESGSSEESESGSSESSSDESSSESSSDSENK